MEVSRLAVSLDKRSYDVAVGQSLLDDLCAFIEQAKPTSIQLITDSNVGPLHADAVNSVLDANNVFSVTAGEKSKSLSQLGELYDSLFATGQIDRSALIIALGGGMVGDLAGFVASTLMRGVRYIHVPTSLLAMVDSSVGGKTAINHNSGKNLIGAFHQPAGVFCDLTFLKTLPQREYISALAEVVKTALISGDEFISVLEQNVDAILNHEPEILRDLIERCIRFKAGVVAADETETSGQRATLNFGHTLAHVLEAAWPERWLHGEAVSIGLVGALRMSAARSGLDAQAAERSIQLLRKFKLPVDVPPELDSVQLLKFAAGDKKRAGDDVNFVVVSELGKPQILPCKFDADFAAILLDKPNA